jgi:hypothetical protein
MLARLLPGLLLTACAPEKPARDQTPVAPAAVSATSASPTPAPIPSVAYSEVFKITYSSCLPCHNRKTLPQVIERVKRSSADIIGDEERVRIIGELEELKAAQDEGVPLGFSSGQKELLQLFDALPGEFYTVLEKGVMPPSWAPALMDTIEWPNYTFLTPENRAKLLIFGKPYAEKYLP